MSLRQLSLLIAPCATCLSCDAVQKKGRLSHSGFLILHRSVKVFLNARTHRRGSYTHGVQDICVSCLQLGQVCGGGQGLH